MLLYDSDNPDAIPGGVFAAGYVDGYAASAWSARGWARFPNAKRIAVWATTNDGDVLDVERFNATPEQAGPWAKRARARGVAVPWIYVDRSDRPAVERSLILSGLLSDQVALWIATLDGTQAVAAGPYPVAAVQFASSRDSGGHYDLSIVNPLYGSSADSLEGDKMVKVYRNPVDGSEWQLDALATVKYYVDGERSKTLDLLAKLEGQPGVQVIDNANQMLDRIPTAAALADGPAILAALADLKAHPAAVADPALAGKIDALAKHLGIGSA